MIDLLLIGAGAWGKNYISTLSSFPGIKLSIADRHNWQRMLDRKPDGVIIATPPRSHIEIACYVSKHNIPVMIEKPLALSFNEIKELEPYAASVLVNHQHLFCPAFLALQSIVGSWDRIDTINTRGYGDGPFRDYSSLFDYGSHDLSMCFALIKGKATIEYASEMHSWHSSGSLFDLHLDLDGVRVFSQIGNGAKNKSRYFDVLGSGGVVVYDDQREPKLTYNGQGVSIDPMASLTASTKAFLQMIEGRNVPHIGLELPKQVIAILEQANEMLHKEVKQSHLLVDE
jgi:predicted dehydrogenase